MFKKLAMPFLMFILCQALLSCSGSGVILVSPSSLSSAIKSVSYSETITASGGSPPYLFSITDGALPPGLTFNSNTGEISGIPTDDGTFNFTVTATDQNVMTGSRNYSLVVQEMFAYVYDGTTAVQKCTLSASGSFTSADCTVMTNSTEPGFIQSAYTAFQTFSGTTYAYVSDASSNLWKCSTTATGDFNSNCTALTNTPAFANISVATLQAFGETTYAYVADSSNTLWQCPMNSTGDFNGDCTALTNTPAFNTTAGITFASFSGTTYAYVANISSTLWKCPLTATGGFSGVCTALTNTPAFNTTSIVAFQTFAGTTYGYVTDLSSRLWKCPMDANGSFSGGCTALTNTPPFTNTNVVSLQSFSGTTYAYLGDGSTNVWQCPLDADTGNFSSDCIASSGFSVTIGATLYPF